MDNYRSHLKLDFDPFEPGSNSRDFFTGGKRGDLLEQLIELSLHSKSLAVVTGSLGSGKSTLAKQICLSFREDAECVLVGATLFMNKPQFLEAIVEQLSLNPFEPSLSLQDSSDPGQAASLREEIIIENSEKIFKIITD